LLLFVALACNGARTPSAASPDAASGPPAGPSAATEPAPPGPPPPLSQAPVAPPDDANACQADADCVITCARPNDCCDQLCGCSNAVSATWLAGHQAWKGEQCTEAVCPIAACAPPRFEAVARCVENRCKAELVERAPLAPTQADKPLPPG
jgi:hypothetical protein